MSYRVNGKNCSTLREATLEFARLLRDEGIYSPVEIVPEQSFQTKLTNGGI